MPPQERKVRSTLGTIIHYLVAFFDLLIFVSGLLIILMILTLQKNTNRPGWALVFLGIITLLGPIIGSFGARCTRLKFLTKFAKLLTILATIGCAAFTISLFASSSEVSTSLYTRTMWSKTKVETFFERVRWAFLGLFILEVVTLVLTCVNQKWIPVEYYENLEQTTQRRDIVMETAKHDASANETKAENARAAALATKMKQKYGKWNESEWSERRGP